MPFEKRKLGKTVIIKPIGESLAIDFKNQLLNGIRGNEKCLLFDFSNIKKINSESLTILISLYKALGDTTYLGIYGLSPELQKIIELTGMIKIFHLFDSEEEGIKYSDLL